MIPVNQRLASLHRHFGDSILFRQLRGLRRFVRRRIARRAPSTGYAAAAAVAATIVTGHARELGAATDPLEPDDVVPITDEPDGFAFDCGAVAGGDDLSPPGGS